MSRIIFLFSAVPSEITYSGDMDMEKYELYTKTGKQYIIPQPYLNQGI